MHQSKPGVDWAAIQARYLDGESAASIARDAGVSKQAISKRARKEQWHAPKALQAIDGGKWIVAATAMTELEQFRAAKPELIAKALHAISCGANHTVAAGIIGVSREAWRRWRNACPALETAITEAQAQQALEHLGHMTTAARNDWRAAEKLLNANPLTRGEFADRASGGLTVQININRASPDEQAAVIDISPTDSR